MDELEVRLARFGSHRSVSLGTILVLPSIFIGALKETEREREKQREREKWKSQWLPIFRRMAPVEIISLSSMRSRFLGKRQTSKGSGVTVTPALPRKLGKDEPCGDRSSNVCINELKNKNSSMRASTSPRHMRLPTPKGIKYSGFCTLPSAERNRLGRNSSGFSQSSGSMCTACSSGTT